MLIYVTVPPMVALAREHTRDVALPFFNDMVHDLKDVVMQRGCIQNWAKQKLRCRMSKQCLSIMQAAVVTSPRRSYRWLRRFAR